MLKILNCSKAFGGLSVLDNVTLEVEKHEIVSIMGPSGIGKSTLLRCICGLEEMDEGVIEIDGLVENRNHKIGYVFQNYNLFPHRTVFENCVDSLYLKEENKEDANARVTTLLQNLNIWDKKDCYPYQLSGGQKQRVAIARACALTPGYICFDEPTSALDAKSCTDVIELIKLLAKDNLGILVVTHDREFAKKISTRIISLE